MILRIISDNIKYNRYYTYIISYIINNNKNISIEKENKSLSIRHILL